jgi:hypothetical protein
MKEAANRLSREAFLARYGSAVLLPTRVIGGEIKRAYAASKQLTMVHGAREDDVVSLTVGRAHSLSRGTLAPRRAPLSIGRIAECDVTIADYTISKMHASWTPGRYPNPPTLTDQGSRNGTWVGDHRLEQGVPHPVHSRDEIRFGRIVLTYITPVHLYERLTTGA